MIVAISRIRVVSGNEEAIAAQYRQRLGAVEEAPGFLGLEILQEQDRPEAFLVLMRWRERADFEAYRRSEAFRRAHERIAALSGRTRIDRESYQVSVYEIIGG